MSIIVIGNGPSLLKKDNGEKINSFETVVRFNAYTIIGYEQHVGTKTDFWFNTINFQNKSNEWRTNQNYSRIYLHSWEWNPEKDKLYKEFIEYYKDSNVVITKTKRDTVLELKEYINDAEYTTYSTGAIAIWMLLKEYNHVVITGFDWWESDQHHYNDKAPRGKIHKPEKEFVLLKKLEANNLISFLQ